MAGASVMHSASACGAYGYKSQDRRQGRDIEDIQDIEYKNTVPGSSDLF